MRASGESLPEIVSATRPAIAGIILPVAGLNTVPYVPRAARAALAKAAVLAIWAGESRSGRPTHG